MNPMFFFPFILTPIVNVCMFKFFVDVLGMNSIMYTMPWTLPGFIGIPVSTGFAPLSFVYVALIIVLDILVYWPFFRAYDKSLLAEEVTKEETVETTEENGGIVIAASADHELQTVDNQAIPENSTVLVLCAGGGTSGILANALNKLATERGLSLSAAARAYGQDMDLIQDMDLVILAPQMDSMKNNLKKITDKYGVKMVSTSGKQYIELTRDGDKALAFVSEQLSNN